MASSKSAPGPRRPVARDGWVRKSDLDAWLDRHLPVPTRVVTNEEYQPLPQTARQRRVEEEVLARADERARRLGMDRRQFLRTSCGMATAFAALNTVFGRLFEVEAVELLEPTAAAGRSRAFIFDVQTHHVALPAQAPRMDQEFLQSLVGLRGVARRMNPALKDREPRVEDIQIETYVKEVFLDSETDVVALSTLPGESEETDVLTPDVVYKTRTWIDELARSPRVISHGYFSPDLGQQNLEYMRAQMERLKIDAWKGYTGVARARGKQGWRLDDETLAYPALELAAKQGVKNICVHKGLPFPGDPAWWSPMDVVRPAVDFPQLNFLVYHAGFRGLADGLPAAADGFVKTGYIPWTSDICQWKKKNPQVKNVYMELGSTFALMVSANPLLAAYVVGMMIDAFGADRVLWGTDSVWWGSPQWQIEAFRRLEVPAELAQRFGFAPLTDDVKRQVFGLNAARVYGVDPEAKRNPVPADYLTRLRELYKQSGLAAPSHTQYGWVRAETVAEL